MKLDKGIRIVACFEAFKGLFVLFAGFGLLSLLNRDAARIAEALVGHFHINPASRYPRIFLELASNITNVQIWLTACIAFAYATLRLVEAYGLWQKRRWAEWLAVASGGIYIPIELYELFHRISWIHASTLIINVSVVIYMLYVLKNEKSLSPGD